MIKTKIKKYIFYFTISLQFLLSNNFDHNKFNIARIHYGGGGDWYSDPSSVPNLLDFINKNTMIIAGENDLNVKIGDDEFYLSNYLYITGHGNINLSSEEVAILRGHLLNGAFLHADDNYGMDKSFRKLVSSLFPEKEFIEIPPSHNLFNCFYKFPNVHLYYFRKYRVDLYIFAAI